MVSRSAISSYMRQLRVRKFVRAEADDVEKRIYDNVSAYLKTL